MGVSGSGLPRKIAQLARVPIAAQGDSQYSALQQRP